MIVKNLVELCNTKASVGDIIFVEDQDSFYIFESSGGWVRVSLEYFIGVQKITEPTGQIFTIKHNHNKEVAVTIGEDPFK